MIDENVVRRRTGGLEKVHKGRGRTVKVRRRKGGLEITTAD